MPKLEWCGKCRFCDFEGEFAAYVGFYPNEKINAAHNKDGAMPRYGYHLGLECPLCKRWQKWVTQDKEMFLYKFYAKLA